MYLEPGLARLAGICYVPESAEEAQPLEQALYGFLGRQLQALVFSLWHGPKGNTCPSKPLLIVVRK